MWYDAILQDPMGRAYAEGNEQLLVTIVRKRMMFYSKQLRDIGYAAFDIKKSEIIEKMTTDKKLNQQMMQEFELNQRRLPTVGTKQFNNADFITWGKHYAH